MEVPFVFVPGYKQKETSPKGSYLDLLNVFAGAGYQSHLFIPDWESADPMAWVDETVEFILRLNAEDVDLGGFSFGAAIIPIVAAELRRLHQKGCGPRVGALVLASMSPVYDRCRDVAYADPALNGGDMSESLHGQRYSEFRRLPYSVVAQFVSMELPSLHDIPVQVYHGQDEVACMEYQARDIVSRWPQARRIVVPPPRDRTDTMLYHVAAHNVLDTGYLDAIAANVGDLRPSS